jgi:hypothetical protein
MKHRFYIVSALFLAVALLYGCDEAETEGVSKVTFYAEITLAGDQWNSIPQGGTWTEPGVTATEEGEEIEVQIGGDAVNPNVPGVYTIEYTAINRDGFPATEYRYVGVISPDVVDDDLSGLYQRQGGVFGFATIAKVPGKLNLYTSNNVGGVAPEDVGTGTTVRFYHYAPGLLGFPYQLVQGSPFYGLDATVEEDGSAFTWTVINGGYGNAPRLFTKQ